MTRSATVCAPCPNQRLFLIGLKFQHLSEVFPEKFVVAFEMILRFDWMADGPIGDEYESPLRILFCAQLHTRTVLSPTKL